MAYGFTNDLGGDIVELAPYVPAETAPLREVAFRKDAWLATEVADLRRLFADDTPVDVIATTLARPLAGVRSKLSELGLRRNTSRPWSEWEEAEVLARYGRDAASTIAQDLGRGVSAVYQRAALLGLQDTAAPPYTPWEDAQIRVGYQLGVPVAQIAAMIGRPVSGLVTHAWRSLGLRHANQPEAWSSEELARALELANEGHRYLRIIDMLAGEGFPRRSKAGFGPKIRQLGYGRGWGKPWTADEDELLRRTYAAGGSIKRLGAQLGRSQHSMMWRAKTLGLQGSHVNRNGFRQGPDWTEEETAMLVEGYGAGRIRDLAAKIGRPLSAVYQKAHHLGLKNDWCRDFSADEDLAIQIAWRQGLGLNTVAEALNRQPRVIWERAERLGLAFGSPDRPVKPNRGKRKPSFTLAGILALEGEKLAAPENALTPKAAGREPRRRRSRATIVRPRDQRRARRAGKAGAC